MKGNLLTIESCSYAASFAGNTVAIEEQGNYSAGLHIYCTDHKKT